MSEADDSSGLRLRIHHLMFLMTVYAVLHAWLVPKLDFEWKYTHIHFLMSVALWSWVSCAFLVLVAWKLRKKVAHWHPADSLIVLPWAMFLFNPMTFEFWTRLLQWEGTSVETFTNWFIFFPALLALAWIAVIWLCASSLTRLWHFILGVIATKALLRIIGGGLEKSQTHIQPDSLLAQLVDGYLAVDLWLERVLPFILAVLIAYATWPRKEVDKKCSWPRWWLIVGSFLICMFETVYWVQILM